MTHFATSQATPPWTAVIPVRAGSKGLPGKNTRLLAGKPLYLHAVDQALEAGAHHVIITTDISHIIQAPAHNKVSVIPRSALLSADNTPMAPVLIDAISKTNVQGVMVLLQATSPLRNANDIQEALKVFHNHSFDLVMSVCAADKSILKWGFVESNQFKPISNPEYCFSNRQSLPDIYRPNGAIYICQAQWFVQNKGFATHSIGVYPMPEARSFDIDDIHDFERCEQLLLSSNTQLNS